jgi:glycosyltransferase involved in cell wall biosynthesis
VAKYLQSCGVADERLRIVANGVPTRATLPHKAAAPARWTIGFIALLRPRKGLEVFLDAAAQLKSRGLPIQLRIVGRFETAGYEEEIHRRAGELGLSDIIDWRGFQQQIDAELDAMDLLAFPSVLPEGMPMVVLEAMAAGVPIVASEVNGVVDVLRDRKSALLVSPGDAESLANALATLVEDQRLRDRLRLSAFDQQREQFSDYSMAAAVAAIYRNIVAPKGAVR